MKQTLNEFVKKIFSACGLRINKIGAQRIPMAEVLDHVVRLGFKPNVVIDVGVANGTFDLYDKFPCSKFLLVEPIKEWEDALKEISRKYDAEYVIAAAGAKSGKIVINIESDPLASSTLQYTDRRVMDAFPREVPVVTIDDLCRQKKLRGPYLFKLDVQGAELCVLDGAKEVLEEAEVVVCEVSFFQFNRDCPQFFDVVSYLKNRGFVVYDICGFTYRPFDGALGQVDLVFVKENGQFRKCNRW